MKVTFTQLITHSTNSSILNSHLNLGSSPLPDSYLDKTHIGIITFLGILCNIVQPLIYLAPIKCFLQMIKSKVTEKIPVYYFLLSLLNSFTWIIIAIKETDIALLTANLIMSLFFVVFLMGYIITYNGKNLFSLILQLNAAFLSIIVYLYLAFNYLEFALCATVAIVVESACYFSILQYIKEVFEYEDPSYIDFPIVVSIFIVDSLWVIYAAMEKNWVLFSPNLIGVMISSGLLYVNYHFTMKRMKKDSVKSF
mmetsp:Transcript_31634/g.32857  ORF Transcript_31634/g.32857 Transcript_31634/m.32857 type:complete len:253 (+) Transcript_31634:1-759(+)